MTLKTRMYMSILYLIHKKELLTLENILRIGGMPQNLAHTVVNNLEVPAVVNQFTTEIDNVDIKLESLGLNKKTIIPIKFVQSKSQNEPDLVNGYIKVDSAMYEKTILELIADLPTIQICSQWECIKQEGMYTASVAHEMIQRLSQYHPVIVLNAIEHYYKPNESLYNFWLSKILETSEEWNSYLNQLLGAISDLIKTKYKKVKEIDFSNFTQLREVDLQQWLKSEFIPEEIKLFVRADMEKNRWIVEICDKGGAKCSRVEIQKDLSDLKQAIEKMGLF
jgi:hypothetical protein